MNQQGHYIKILGPAGSIETETSAILHEHGIPHDPFSKAVVACLPLPSWKIDDDEYPKRKDFRDLIVCSVDPPGYFYLYFLCRWLSISIILSYLDLLGAQILTTPCIAVDWMMECTK